MKDIERESYTYHLLFQEERERLMTIGREGQPISYDRFETSPEFKVRASLQ